MTSLRYSGPPALTHPILPQAQDDQDEWIQPRRTEQTPVCMEEA